MNTKLMLHFILFITLVAEITWVSYESTENNQKE